MKCRPQSRGGSFGGIPGDCGPGAGVHWTVPTDLRTDRTAASSPGCSGRHMRCQWLLAEDGNIGIQTRGRVLARMFKLHLVNHISTHFHKLLILAKVCAYYPTKVLSDWALIFHSLCCNTSCPSFGSLPRATVALKGQFWTKL